MQKISETVKHLIIINVIFFIAVQILGYNIYDLFALWSPINSKFELWQIISHMFMHSPTFIPHILMNMLGLWMFGTPLEQMWGRNKFLFFYFSAGLGAVVLPFIIDYYQLNNIVSELVSLGFDNENIFSTLKEGKYNTAWENVLDKDTFTNMMSISFKSMVGASGAIMGLLAAFGLNFPNAKLALIFLPVPIAAKYFIPVLLTYEVLSGIFGWSSIFGVNIAHFAHVGGALIGFIIAWYWKKNQFRTY